MFHDYVIIFNLHIVWFGLLLILTLLAAADIIYTQRDETDRTLLWLLLLATQPVIGFLLYILFGRSRKDTVGRRIAFSAVEFRRKIRSRTKRKDYFSAIAEFLPDYSLFNDTYKTSRTLDRLLPETMPLKGNKIELLHDGTDAYPAMIEAIRNANQRIYLQSFIIANDSAGETLFHELRKKAEQDVEIRVLYDGFGSFFPSFSKLFRNSKKDLPNFQIRPFSLSNRPAQWNLQLRNHRKLLITDSDVAFMGGINISHKNLAHRSDRFIHDLHFKVEGPAVMELLAVFLRDWYYVTKGNDPCFHNFTPQLPEWKGDTIMRVVASGFGQLPEGSANVFQTAAATAEDSLWIISPYFVPDAPFVKALCMAAARGVDVRIIVPNLNNHFYVKMASRSLYSNLLSSGVRIFEREKIFVHTKAMLVDRKWAMIGSSNCDIRSFRLNLELDAVIRGEQITKELYEFFKSEMADSSEIFLSDVEQKNYLIRVVENICGLFAPVL